MTKISNTLENLGSIIKFEQPKARKRVINYIGEKLSNHDRLILSESKKKEDAKFSELNRKEQVKNKVVAIMEIASNKREVPTALKESLKAICKESDFVAEMIVIMRNADGTVKYRNLVKYVGNGFEILKETFGDGEINAKFQKCPFGLLIDKFNLDFAKYWNGCEVLVSEKTIIANKKGKETEKELTASLIYHRLKTAIIANRAKLLSGVNSNGLLTNILNAKLDISANKKALKVAQD
jgi:hypothetical protein